MRLRDGIPWTGRVAVAVTVTLACAACGTSTHTASPARGSASGSSSAGTARVNAGLAVVTVAHIAQPLTPAARAFAQMADNVCQVVREGAPATLARPLTTARIARYVKAADAAAARTVVSLRRLAGQRHSRTLLTLADAYASLRALYAHAGSIARRRLAAPTAQYVGEQVQISERELTAAAFDAGMPACGVNGA